MTSKELEALKRLYDLIIQRATPEQTAYSYSDYVIIKTELERLKKQDRILRIITEKRVNMDEIYHKDYEWYLLDHKNDDESFILTKNEFYLLKERSE